MYLTCKLKKGFDEFQNLLYKFTANYEQNLPKLIEIQSIADIFNGKILKVLPLRQNTCNHYFIQHCTRESSHAIMGKKRNESIKIEKEEIK